ncbi:DUF805 domain-containing protein [Ferrovibrio terrae]|uniref:DUF805 domain-containing protein n=1 Tax=Ferrovibrio terrae TaxID=2594003 RepID=UPI003137EB82
MRSVIARLFPLHGRRSPGGYGRVMLIYILVNVVVWGVALATQIRPLGFLAMLVTGIFILSTYFTGAQRCRDLTLPGWAILAVFIPGFGFLLAVALCFIPGTRGPNKYGPDPLDPFAPALPAGAALAGMSKPVFSDLFRASGRRNRKSYLLLHLAMMVVGLVWVIAAVGALADMNTLGVSQRDLPPVILVIQIAAFVVGIPMTVIGILAMVQRCHDFSRSGWWALLWLIPGIGAIFWIALFFIPGTRGPNKYGPDPRASTEALDPTAA